MISTGALRAWFLRSKLAGGICRRLGIDREQYVLLIWLFSSLASRMEFMGIQVSLAKAAGGNAALSLFLSLAVFARPSLGNYFAGVLILSMFFLIWILLEDTANSLLNAEEASVLAHQPIGGATYVAAKLTHVAQILGVFVPSLNVIPALAGAVFLAEARWFYPLTHLLAMFLAGAFVAFFIFGLYGWLFRFFPPERLKNMVLWVQVLYVGAPALLQMQRLSGPGRSGFLQLMSSPWLPLRWFTAVGLLGQGGAGGYPLWQAAVAPAVTLGLIAWGMRSFREDYLVKASALLQGSAKPTAGSRRLPMLSGPVRRLTGAGSGYAAFAFAGRMMRRDWHFRRQAVPLMLMYGIMAIGVGVEGLRTSPFTPPGPFSMKTFSTIHLLPHFLGFLCMIPCGVLAFTAQPLGAWIFTTLPMDRLRPYARGVYLALWLPLVCLPHLVLLGPCIWFYGAAQGALFVGFSAALVSTYLGMWFLAVGGLPFASAFSPSRAEFMRYGMLILVALAFVFSAIQWLVFRSLVLVPAAALVLALAAVVLARAGFGKLEKEIRSDVELLRLGPQRLFKEVVPGM